MFLLSGVDLLRLSRYFYGSEAVISHRAPKLLETYVGSAETPWGQSVLEQFPGPERPRVPRSRTCSHLAHLCEAARDQAGGVLPFSGCKTGICSCASAGGRGQAQHRLRTIRHIPVLTELSLTGGWGVSTKRTVLSAGRHGPEKCQERLCLSLAMGCAPRSVGSLGLCLPIWTGSSRG